MKNSEFNKLVESIREAGQIKQGRSKPGRTFKFRVPDIIAIRTKLRVSQSDFALMMGVSPRTLQNWEQGRRKPDGPARALLTIAEKNPKALLAALHN